MPSCSTTSHGPSKFACAASLEMHTCASSKLLTRKTQRMKRRISSFQKLVCQRLGQGLAFAALAFNSFGGTLYVPNFSFESPNIGTNSPYAAPVLFSWGIPPQPSWYNPSDFQGQPWAYNAGTFYNQPDFTNSSGSNTAFIYNCDGAQAAYLFALPEVAIYQDYNSVGETDFSSNAFAATFTPGKNYTLTVGVIGGGGGMAEGSTLQLSLYYRDASNNMVTVAETTVTNTPETFPTDTEFVDFSVRLPAVQSTDAWAGKHIGMQILATPDFEDPSAWGGYWDVDNVRLQEGIYVPNFSFEAPNIGTNSPYAAPVFFSWAIPPQPSWYNPSNFEGQPWAYNAGTFYNLPNFTNSSGSNTTFIYNCDGAQAAFLFALPQVGIFQDYRSVGETDSSTHAFTATFNPGKAYTLTVGVIGGGGGMPEGSTLQLSLYYVDSSSNMITVAATTVTNTLEAFPSDEELVDFKAQTPAVKPTDPWAGQHIGIQILATPDFFNPGAWGGYWDVDNVRLNETTALNLADPAIVSGQMQFTVESEPGAVVQILTATNLSLSVSNWTRLATVTNTTGSLPYLDQSSSAQQRFYSAQPSP